MNSAWLSSPIFFRSRLLSFSILGLSLFSVNSYTSEVYVWKDTQGNLHFSDFPEHKDAKRIELPDAPPPPQVLNESDVDWTSSSLTDKEDKSSSALPLSVSIRSPQHDATIRSNAGVSMLLQNSHPISERISSFNYCSMARQLCLPNRILSGDSITSIAVHTR